MVLGTRRMGSTCVLAHTASIIGFTFPVGSVRDSVGVTEKINNKRKDRDIFGEGKRWGMGGKSSHS